MGIRLDAYRAAIGLFNCHMLCKSRFCISTSLTLILGIACLTYVMFILYLIILLCGDIEINPGPRSFNLTIGHINARSLNMEDKFDEISSIVLDRKFDIFAVSETWLGTSILSETLDIPGFGPMFRLDRQDGRRGGGVAPYISSTIAARRRSDLEIKDLELLWVEVKFRSVTLI